MTNEELVARIQNGEQELLELLWDQVERFVAWRANMTLHAIGRSHGVTFDDLYNSGFLAVVEAVETYTPDGKTFCGWLMYYLKTEFAKATGFRTKADREDPIRHAISLSSPILDEDNDGTLSDLTPDPDAERLMEAVEDKIWHEQLKKTVDEVLDKIPEEGSEIIRSHYLSGKTLKATAAELGMSQEEARKKEGNTLQLLRRHQYARRLLPFYNYNFYKGTGFQSFMYTGYSAQEKYLLERERHESWMLKKAAERSSKGDKD